MSKVAPATDGHAKPTRTIAVLNQKGGVGKTTSTVNLGAALAAAGLRVCMIDMDPQAHLTLHFGIDPEQIGCTVYDLLIDPECYATDSIINARPNLDVIVSEVDLAAAETELSQTDDRQTILRRKIESISSAYDVVLIDCPPSLGLLTLNALSMATEVFVPMQAHFLALQGVGKLLETVGLVCQSINPSLRVTGIILCMHEAQTSLAKEIVSDLDSFFTAARGQSVPWRDCRVLKPPIRRNVKLAEAPSFGKTIFDYEPTCPGASDYRMLAHDLMVSWGFAAAIQSEPAVVPAAPAISPMPVAPAQIATRPSAKPTLNTDAKAGSKPTAIPAATAHIEPKVSPKPATRPTRQETPVAPSPVADATTALSKKTASAKAAAAATTAVASSAPTASGVALATATKPATSPASETRAGKPIA